MKHPVTRGQPRARLFVPLLVALSAAACGGDHRSVTGVTAPPASRSAGTTQSVVVSPSSASGSLGQSAQFTATAYDAGGHVLSGTTATWRSGDPTIVAVTASGFATAVGVGSTALSATISGVTGTAPVQVAGTPIASITLSPGSATGTVGQSAQFTASLRDASGATITGRPARWTSSDSTIVTVDSTGLATAVGPGSASVVATSAGVSGSAAITVTGVQQVTAPGTITDLAAAAAGDSGLAVSFTAVSNGAGQPASYEVRFAPHPISWGSASPVTAGTCQSAGAGVAVGGTVHCTVIGLSASTAYDVQAVAYRGRLGVSAVFGALSNVATATTNAAPSPVASVTVSPGSATGNVGDKGQFSAVAKDVAGNAISGAAVAWSTSNAAVVTVDSTGLATGVGAGTAYVIATVAGVAGRAQVSVNAPSGGTPGSGTVGTVSVSPTSATLAVGATRQLTSIVTDLLGAVLGSATTTWTSSAPSVATVSTTGLVTAVSAGTATITVASGGIAATCVITVSASGAPAGSSAGEPSPSAGVTIWHDGFDAYTSAANLLTSYDYLNGESHIVLDLTGGTGGTPAMRIDWPAQTATGNCRDDDHLIERGFPATQEIYAQYYVRYQAGFVFDWSGRSTCSGNAKKLFLMPGGTGSRLDLISENHHIVLYEDQVGYASGLQNVGGSEFTPEMLGDGRWHRITIHARLSSSPGANDGVIEGWIDGVKRWSEPNPVSGTGYTYFQTPTVFNQGSPVAQSEWMDDLVVWKP